MPAPAEVQMPKLGEGLCQFLDSKGRCDPASIADKALKAGQSCCHTQVACIDRAVSDLQVCQSSQGIDEHKACNGEALLKCPPKDGCSQLHFTVPEWVS